MWHQEQAAHRRANIDPSRRGPVTRPANLSTYHQFGRRLLRDFKSGLGVRSGDELITDPTDLAICFSTIGALYEAPLTRPLPPGKPYSTITTRPVPPEVSLTHHDLRIAACSLLSLQLAAALRV